ncbi:hypothetical protein EV363DRAFT_1156462 [Boletus edulis]|nr:hypothetical protein EV363DRAFT_1156462 [Boletus edulis]
MSSSNQDLTFRTYHIVLLFEAFVMTTWISTEFLFFPVVFAHQVPSPHLVRHFGLLTSITALMLSGSLYITLQRKPRWIQVCWHLLYRVSYLASFCYAWRITLQAGFPDWFADGLPHDFFGRGILLAIIMLVVVVVDIPYVILMAAAIGKRDPGGPISNVYQMMRR